MRLWSKQLLNCLPRQQLLGQWRELALIARDIHTTGKTNHILINKIMDYPLEHFKIYSFLVYKEMINRSYKVNETVKQTIFSVCDNNNQVEFTDLYSGWHNERYLRQCVINLEEKADCGGLTVEEWNLIENYIKQKGDTL